MLTHGLTKSTLEDLLSDKVEKPSATASINQSSKGPGALNKFALIEGDTSAWIDVKEKKKKTKKSVIFADGLFALNPSGTIKDRLVAALIDHYHVFLWQDSVIETLKPSNRIQSLNQFYVALDALSPSSEGDIKIKLTKHNLDYTKYIILDHARINTLCESFQQKRCPSVDKYLHTANQLNLNGTQLSLDDPILKQSVDFSQIECVAFYAATYPNLDLFIPYFPNLKRIVVLAATRSWVIDNLETKMMCTLEGITFKDAELTGLNFYHFYNVIKLSFVQCINVPAAHELPPYLEELDIEDCMLKAVNLGFEKTLIKKLTLKNVGLDKEMELKVPPTLYSLTTKDVSNGLYLTSPILKNLINIEHLTINCHNEQELDLTNLAHLKTIDITNADDKLNVLKLPKGINSIKLNATVPIDIKTSAYDTIKTVHAKLNTDTFNLPSELKKLEELTIECEAEDTLINLASLDECERLTIKNGTISDIIPKKIKDLSLTNTEVEEEDFSVIDLPQTLESFKFEMDWRSLPYFTLAFEKTDKLRSIKLSNVSLESLDPLNKASSQIEYFELVNFNEYGIYNIDPNEILDVDSVLFNHVEEMTIDTSYLDVANHPTLQSNLRYLSMHINSLYSNKDGFVNFEEFKKLSILILEGSEIVKVKLNSNLHSFHVDGSGGGERNFIDINFDHTPYLQDLFIKTENQDTFSQYLPVSLKKLSIESATDSGLVNFLPLPKLRSLSLTSFQVDDWEDLYKRAEYIEEIILKDCSQDTQFPCIDLHRYKNLKHVTIIKFAAHKVSIIVPPCVQVLHIEHEFNLALKFTEANESQLQRLSMAVSSFEPIDYTHCKQLAFVEIVTPDKNDLIDLPTFSCLSTNPSSKYTYFIDYRNIMSNASATNNASSNAFKVALYDTLDNFNFDNAVGDEYSSDVSLASYKCILHGVASYHYRLDVGETIRTKNEANRLGLNVDLNFTPQNLVEVSPTVNPHAREGQTGEIEIVKGITGQRFALASSYPVQKDDLILYTKNDHLIFYYDETLEQFYFTLKNDIVAENPVHFDYILKSSYTIIPEKQLGMMRLYTKENRSLLNEYLRLHLAQPDLYLNTRLKYLYSGVHFEGKIEPFTLQGRLPFIYSKDLSLEEKHKKLEEFCLNFKNEKIALKESLPFNRLTGLDRLLSVIMEQKGSCRHRAGVFALFSQLMGVATRFPTNEDHLYCEVPYEQPYQDKSPSSKPIYVLRDFSGSAYTDLTPASARMFSTALQHPERIADTNTPASEQQSIHRRIRVTPPHQNVYDEYFNERNKVTECQSISMLLNPANKYSPLILLEKNQSPFEVNGWIVSELSKSAAYNIGEKHLYIHSVKNFAYFLEPKKYVDGRLQRVEHSILKNILLDGGVLVINLSHFNASELAHYKSMFDTLPLKPTLGSLEISPKTRIIAISQASTNDSSVLSRMKKYSLSKSIELQFSKNEIALEPVEEIELYGHYLWETETAGDIDFEGHLIHVRSNGKLINALKEQRSVCFYNPPPADKRFIEMFERLRTENKFYHNGEVILASRVASYSIKSRPINNPYHFKEITNVPAVYNTIHLDASSWHQLFEQQSINNSEKSITTTHGLLKQLNTSTQFVVSGSIQEVEINRLYYHVHSHQINIEHFYFDFKDEAKLVTLTKDTTIKNEENQTSAMAPAIIHQLKSIEELPQECVTLFTNDTDYCAKQLESQLGNVCIIDIHEKTTLNDIVVETKYLWNNALNHFDFTYEIKDVWRLMESGKTVILNGLISPDLYRQLKSLFSETPYIYFNNKAISFTGKLYVVIPLTQQKLIASDRYAIRHYSETDYLRAFQDNSEIISRIIKLKQWTDMLDETPVIPLSYQFLQQLVDASNYQRHLDNPFKGMINVYLEKDASAYFYVNVLIKHLFNKTQHIEFNSLRFNSLKERKSINSTEKSSVQKYFWEILNCGNGSFVQHVFAVLNIETPSVSFSLNQEHILALENLLTNLTHTLVPKQPVMTYSKTLHQLQMLLEEPYSRIILMSGMPGVGKKFAVMNTLKKELNYELFIGLLTFKDWLSSPSDKIKLLFLNKLSEDMHFIRGLNRNAIYYQGTHYKITKNHKVVIKIDPKKVGFFQGHAEMVVFKNPTVEFLQNDVLKPFLTQSKVQLSENEYQQIMRVADHAKTYGIKESSIRDLQSLAARFVLLSKQIKPFNEALYKAAICEFSGRLDQRKSRAAYQQSLQALLGTPKTTPAPGDFFIYHNIPLPQENQFIIDVLEQTLSLRDKAIQSHHYHYKQGVLIEGPSGIGKSYLLETVMQANGFQFIDLEAVTQDVMHHDKLYSRFSAGAQSSFELLKTAAKLNVVVLIDELNLDDNESDFLALLKELLTPEYPGFTAFMSQNPAIMKTTTGHTIEFDGREMLDEQLLDRLQQNYLFAYENETLVNIAKHYRIDQPEEFVTSYLSLSAKNVNINMRTFYQAAQENSNTNNKRSREESDDNNRDGKKMRV